MGVRAEWRRGGALRAMAVAVVAVAVGGPAAPVDSGPAATVTEVVPPTGFGGYSWWDGPVDRVSAWWAVPAISSASPAGHASTWVGAQNPAGGYPFIQLGVTEDTSGPGGAQYHAFWSDTSVGFHPQYLGAVEAGDRLSVAMARVGRGWRLTVRDATRRRTMSRVVPYGKGAAFAQAEWLQEDPTAATAVATDLPYPRMGQEHFHGVRVNGQVPRLDLGNGQALIATGGTVLVPTAFRHDSFAMVVPAGAGKQYLKDVSPLDFAINSYNFELQSWSHLAVSAKIFNVQALVSAYARFAAQLVHQTWPPRARADLARLASSAGRLNADLVAWQCAGLTEHSVQFLRLQQDEDNNLSEAVRTDLGLPRT
jgi:hypothetical protein